MKVEFSKGKDLPSCYQGITDLGRCYRTRWWTYAYIMMTASTLQDGIDGAAAASTRRLYLMLQDTVYYDKAAKANMY